MSSHEQLKGLSFKTQPKACIDCCRSQGMEVVQPIDDREAEDVILAAFNELDSNFRRERWSSLRR